MIGVQMTDGLATRAHSALAKILGPDYVNPRGSTPMRRMHAGELDGEEQTALHLLAVQISDELTRPKRTEHGR